MTKVLVLCHANINRSASCAAVLRHCGIEVESAGLSPNYTGQRAAKKMRDALAHRGYELFLHRSQFVTEAMIAKAGLIVYMDGGNERRLDRMINEMGLSPHLKAEIRKRCVRLSWWAHAPISRIPDPGFMRRDSDDFTFVVDLIVYCSQKLAQNILEDGITQTLMQYYGGHP